MRLALPSAWLALAGCDAVLRFQMVSANDARGSDGATDARGCTPSLDDTMDEDCDGMPDATDLCPADVEASDADNDRVGDVCDPVIGDQDRVVMFDGFAAVNAAWTTITGTWSVADGMMGNMNTDGSISRAVATSRFLAETQVYFEQLGSNPYFILAMTDSTGTSYQCNVYPAAGGIMMEVEVTRSMGVAMISPVEPLVGIGRVRVQLVQDEANGKFICRASYSTTQTISPTLTTATQPLAASQVRLDVSAADVLVDSVTVTGL